MITKDQLVKLAEPGIRLRLEAMQQELNELARVFPHIVLNQDGTVPSVIPVTVTKKTKVAAKTNGHAAAYGSKFSIEQRAEMAASFLQSHPGAATKDIADAVGIGTTYMLKVLRTIATPLDKKPRGSKLPIHWKLKAR